MKRIVVCGGHLTPALAIIEKLEIQKDCQVIFFGRKTATDGSPNLSAEYKEITSRGITFVNIITGRLGRKFTKYTLASYLKIPLGFLLSLLYLVKYRPSIIVSFGGYLSTPIVFGAWFLGIDSITHEQATIPGLANRLNSLFAKKIYLAWPNTQKYFPKEKTEVVGNLQPEALSQKMPKDKKLAAFLAKKGDMILVTGGSQGSHFINRLVFENINLFGANLIFHQIGTADYKNDHEAAAKIKKANYFAIDYVSPEDIGAVIARAKFVISRSGANTVWDLATLAKPAILIPLPIAASGEQMANALILKEAGSAIVISQKDLTAQTLKEAILKMEDGLSEFEKNAKAFQKTLPKDSAQKLLRFIIANI